MTTNIYPDLTLNSAEQSSESGYKIYRLRKIEEIKSQILRERDPRENSYKKIKRILTVLSYVEYGVEALGVSSAAVGIPAILGVVTGPVGLVMEGIAIGAFGAYAVLKYASRRLAHKTKKHDQIRVLADAKLNTIEEYVSHAIEDGDISQEEFVLILSELKKFNEMKERIRSRTSTKLEASKASETSKEEFERQVNEKAEALANERAATLKKEILETQKGLMKKLGE